MRRLLFIIALILSTITLVFTSCEEKSASEEKPQSLEFATEPSEGLSTMIEETASDFTWGFYQDNVQVSLTSGSEWSGQMVLSAFQVKNGEVVNRTTTEPVETTAGELSAGLSTEEMFPGSKWIPGSEWFPGSKWVLGNSWVPGNYWSPSEIEDVALSQFDLSQGESLVVVYAHLAGDSPEREQTTRPFGVLMLEEAATGQLDVSTETSGENQDDSYQITVNETTETIGANESVLFTDLPVGDYEAELSDIADNCEVKGDNPRTVTLTEGVTKTTTFSVSCQQPLKNALAFTSYRDGDAEIFTIKDDGSGVSQLTSNSGFDGQSAVSPNGTQIAFVSKRDGDKEIFVMNADGTGITQLTNNSVLDEHPAWSSDGNKLAFSSQKDGVDEIYTMTSDGSNISRITNNSFADMNPDWSPNDSKLVYETLRDNDREIFIIDTEGSGETQLTNNSGQDAAPDWIKRNGSQLTFVSDRDGDNEIFKMDEDGSDVTQLTQNTDYDVAPSWSADGSSIVFESNRSGGRDIYIINADGTSPFRVTTDPGFDESPSWSPFE